MGSGPPRPCISASSAAHVLLLPPLGLPSLRVCGRKGQARRYIYDVLGAGLALRWARLPSEADGKPGPAPPPWAAPVFALPFARRVVNVSYIRTQHLLRTGLRRFKNRHGSSVLSLMRCPGGPLAL